MPRPPLAIPTIPFFVRLPEDVHARMTLHLYSELENRVPQGDYQRFLVARINEFFDHRHIDLAPYLGCEPGTFHVHGDAASIEQLLKALSK